MLLKMCPEAYDIDNVDVMANSNLSPYSKSEISVIDFLGKIKGFAANRNLPKYNKSKSNSLQPSAVFT